MGEVYSTYDSNYMYDRCFLNCSKKEMPDSVIS